MEGRKRTWVVVSTQAVAGSLANKRNHVRTVLPRFIDSTTRVLAQHKKGINGLRLSLATQRYYVRPVLFNTRYDMCCMYSWIAAERLCKERHQVLNIPVHDLSSFIVRNVRVHR